MAIEVKTQLTIGTSGDFVGSGREARGWRERPLLAILLLLLGKKRKGLQLALEPLNGPGIAGYVPKP
ncbi:MAG TPA: hypothetical protein VNZ48_04425 [Xanthobacteraceae bacterium]|jgi:hypothetical protein|nr:hypothetical protein [Xanthobacteraceae bacterium]